MKNIEIQEKGEKRAELLKRIENVQTRRFFTDQLASIYGGMAGFYEFGPVGAALKSNLINLWKRSFSPGMLELDSCVILPEKVLKASGHVDKFSDVLVFDTVNGECYRADHYVEEKLIELKEKMIKEKKDTEKIEKLLHRVDVLSLEEYDSVIKEFKIKSRNGNDLSNSQEFNLMFGTNIGPAKQNVGYLRPETAQGQFLNFKRCLELNGGKLPMGTFSVGRVFRNEISPRNGLLRVRGFEQAEIEYFVHSNEKVHKKYGKVKDLKLDFLFGKEEQKLQKMKLDDAVKNKIIGNECLAYFIGKTAQFFDMLKIVKYRFRQHKKDEMAHYACDCWDGEIFIGNSWVECVGIADRSCFDLSQHAKHSKTNLFAQKRLDTPKKIIKYEPILDRKNWGKKFKENMKDLIELLEGLSVQENENEQNSSLKLQKSVEFMNETISVEYQRKEVTVHVEDFVPAVIEPSFGVGRIFQGILEQTFVERDEERSYFNFIPELAPYQVCITSLMPKDYLNEQEQLYDLLIDQNLKVYISDQNVSIGKRYSGADEIGIPFFVTFDKDTENDQSVTIRERNSMEQIRVKLEKVPEIICRLIKGDKLEQFGRVVSGSDN